MGKLKLSWMVSAATCALALSACGGPKATLAERMRGEWDIWKVNGRPLDVAEGQRPFIGFDAQEGRVYVYGGCNRLMAGYDTRTGALDFSRMGSTLMAGPGMDLERGVMDALTRARSFSPGQGDTASLCDADGKAVVTLRRRFEPMDFSALRGDWRVVAVDGQAVPQGGEDGPTLSFDVEAMRLAGSTGCNRLMGPVEREEGKPLSVRFPRVSTTRMACPDMSLERAMLSALGEARSFGRLPGGHVALFSEGGMIALELARAGDESR